MSHPPQPAAASYSASASTSRSGTPVTVAASASASANTNVYRPSAAAVAPPATAATAIPPLQYPTQYAYPYAQYSPYQHPGYAYQYYSHPPASTPPAVPPPTYKPTLSLSNQTQTQTQTQYQYQYHQSQPQTQPHSHSQAQSLSQSASTATTASTQPAQATTQSHVPTKTAPKKTQSLKGTFARELRTMMYAFGDSKEPAADSVDVMEEILIEYLVDICHSALAPTRKTRIQIEDLRRALSRFPDGKKLARLEELLFMQDDIRRARKQFSTEEDQIQAQIID